MAGMPIAMLKVTLWLPFGSVPLSAPRVATKLPLAVGVPEIKPVLAFKLRPPGKPLAVKLVGLLVAVIW